MSSGPIQRRIFAEGCVQGVGYRAAVLHRVRGLGVGIRGFVRNLRDGRVEAVFCGPQDAVLLMAQWCAKGPPGSLVRSLTVQEEEPDSELGAFAITRD